MSDSLGARIRPWTPDDTLLPKESPECSFGWFVGFACSCFVCMYMQETRRVSDRLKLELEMVGSCHVGART